MKTFYRRLATKAGIDGEMTPHSARRFFATEWIRKGGSELGLMSTCGWTSSKLIATYTRMHRSELAIAEGRKLLG